MPAHTLYVGSLPESASNERLEEIFSEIGPVKQCFVVKEKGLAKCRGFGYVIYAMEEDALRALKEIKDYDGKKLIISVAKKKLKDTKKTATKEAAAAPPPPPPTKKETDKKSQNIKKQNLKARLIIRNLSFKCSEDDLKQVFAKFGSVLAAKIPLKPDGKMRGFAFVQFKTVCEASIALRAMNLKEIKGRQVAVDWAVPKDKYVAMQATSSPRTTTTEGSSAKQSEPQSDNEDPDEEKNQATSSKYKLQRVGAKKSAPPMEDSQSDDDDEEEDDDDDDGDSEDDEDIADKESQEGEEDDESDHSLDSEEDADDSHDEDEAEDDKSARKKTKKLLPSDVQEGRTIFIRNLSFDTEEEALEKVILQYGDLNYIKIVFHPDTGHSKGCAFAQFKTKEAADRCIAAAQDEAEASGIRVDGRKLLIVAAVSKDDAAKLKVNNKVKVQTGTRNLYLAREGLIRAGTTAAEGVPEADMIKRARFEEVKRTKLRDINVFVSKTRLCVHNLPKSVDIKKLRALCLQAVKEPKGVRISECRIIYDKKPEKGQVMGQSLGYGFVQFQEHEHALATLRYLNNNPNIFGPHKRPIVEFSLEDSRKLKMKEMQRQKNKEHCKKQTGKVSTSSQVSTSRDGKGIKHFDTQVTSPMQKPGKRKAHHDNPTQEVRPNSHSGFQSKPEVEHVDLDNGKKRRKVLVFPSHRGPKIRLRDKGKQRAPPPKKVQQKGSRKERQKRLLEKPTHPKNQKSKAPKSRGGDRFDNLVEQYKKKLLSKSDKTSSMRKNKWFDS